MFVWLVMLGLPILYRHGEHVGFTMITEAMPEKGALVLKVVVHLLVLVFAVIWVKLSWEYCAQLNGKKFSGLDLPQVYVYSSQIASSVLLAVFTLEQFVVDLLKIFKKNDKEA